MSCICEVRFDLQHHVYFDYFLTYLETRYSLYLFSYLLVLADWVVQTGKDRTLSFDPCDVTWFGAKCEAVAVCGSDQACTLFSAEGNRLASINTQHSWVWCCRSRPGENQIVVGCQDGTIETTQLLLPTVHSLYRDRYAYRESLTDVVVQHLSTQQKARIKCRDYVKKIAVYKNRLAIQLSDKILIYEPSTEDPTDMHYRVREKLIQNIECQLLVVTTHNLVVCQGNRLTSLNFQGIKEREWILDGSVRYIRIIGGPATRETLLVGLKNGQVRILLQLFLCNEPLCKIRDTEGSS
ncbi:Intraflagellar transport protein [Paragonimus kellicotti]|nr:Intraflagellar transport protein [Paragonimus kellicotti]